MPKISVIMPCLNMEKYIAKCIESVVNQTLEDIEILVIDAGSTDGTLHILDKYKCRDDRIKLIHSQIKSYGYQMNLGIAEASGEYISIVDTDDKIVPDMYEILYLIAVKTGADYVKGTADYIYTVKDRYTVYLRKYMQFPQKQYGAKGIEIIPEDMPDILLKDPFLWYGIYKSGFFKKIKFHESPGAAYQDFGALLQTQMNAKKAVYIEKTVYEYRQDNMHASGYNPKGFEFIVNEYEWSEKFLRGKSKEWHRAFYCKLFLQVLSRFHAMVYTGWFWEGIETAVGAIQKKLACAMEAGLIAEKDFEPLIWEYFQMFMSDPKTLYEVLDGKWQPCRAEARNILQAAAERETIIFGSGQLGTFLHLLMLNNHIENVRAFCDNSRSAEEAILHELAILSPSEAVSWYPDALYIIASKKWREEMKEQLIELGIEEKNIIVYMGGKYLNLLRERLV